MRKRNAGNRRKREMCVGQGPSPLEFRLPGVKSRHRHWTYARRRSVSIHRMRSQTQEKILTDGLRNELGGGDEEEAEEEEEKASIKFDEMQDARCLSQLYRSVFAFSWKPPSVC